MNEQDYELMGKPLAELPDPRQEMNLCSRLISWRGSGKVQKHSTQGVFMLLIHEE